MYRSLKRMNSLNLNRIVRIQESSKGFTLVELLVGLLLILTIGTIVFSIFTATLRGTNKSSSLNALRHSGSTAMDQITRAIRNAKEFNGVSLNGVDTFSEYCLVPDGQTEPTQYKALMVTTFDDNTFVYRCPLNQEQGIYENFTPLIDTAEVVVNPQNSCYFTCLQSTTAGVPTIGIHFTLTPTGQTGTTDGDSRLEFETRVSPRNFAR